MPNFAHRKKNVHYVFTSKKQKLTIEQNFQRILAQEAATSANENRVNNEFPPNEPMVKSHNGEEKVDARPNEPTIMMAAKALPRTCFQIVMQVLCF
jgi:hypothetical protein